MSPVAGGSPIQDAALQIDPAVMLIDALMPRFDATRAEHRIVDGSIEQVYDAVLRADFAKSWKEKRAVRTLFALRTTAERFVARLRGRSFEGYEEPASMRLGDMPRRGEWILLAQEPPREVAFGAIGRFWGGETTWRESDPPEFAGFSEPGFARIACSFSLRAYGESRTVMSYEARTQATDAQARRAFLRYWRVVAPLAGLVMRAQLAVIAEEARRGT